MEPSSWAITLGLAVVFTVLIICRDGVPLQRNIWAPESKSVKLSTNVSVLLGLDVVHSTKERKWPVLNTTVYTGKLCILLTFHGQPKDTILNNIHVFTPAFREEDMIEERENGLIDVESIEKLELQNLRGMTPLNDVIFVASAHSTTSKIFVVAKCGYRHRKAAIFTRDSLKHPYGIAALAGNIFVTNQNSDTITRYRVMDGSGARAHYFATVKSPRGLSFDNDGRLWVASTKKGVYIFDQDGRELHRINIVHPVGVVTDRKSGLIYVGSYDGYKSSQVYVFDPSTLKVLAEIRPPQPYRLGHPAGLAIDGEYNVLFVVAQKERLVYAFDLTTYKFLGIVVKDLKDEPEQILLSKCVF